MKRDLKQAAKAVAAAGRHGDTELVHLSKMEKALLVLALGAGTINPATGLEEHFNFLDPLGIVDNVTNFAEKYIPGFDSIHSALAKIPGSPSAFVEGARMKNFGSLYGDTANAGDTWLGGTELSQDPKQRKLGRAFGTAAGAYFGGQALAGGMGGGGAGYTIPAEVAADYGTAYGAMAPEAAGLYSSASEAGAYTIPADVGAGYETAYGGMTPEAGGLYEAAGAPYEILADVGADYGTAYGNMGPGAAGNKGFFGNLMQQYGVTGTPGETYLQRMMRLAKGGGRLYNIGSGLSGLYQANQMRQLAKPGQEAAKRQAYLEANPTAIQGIPGYAAGKAAMIQARDRLLAREGQTGGGMALEAAMKSEGAYDTQFRGTEMQRLQSVAQGGVPAQINYAELVSRSLASIGYGFGPQQIPRRS